MEKVMKLKATPNFCDGNLMGSSGLDVCTMIISSMLLSIVTLYFFAIDNIDQILASELTLKNY